MLPKSVDKKLCDEYCTRVKASKNVGKMPKNLDDIGLAGQLVSLDRTTNMEVALTLGVYSLKYLEAVTTTREQVM